MVLLPTGSLKNQSELDASSPFLSFHEELLGSSYEIEHLAARSE